MKSHVHTISLWLPLLFAAAAPLFGAGGAEPGVPLPLSTVEQWGVAELRIESGSFTVVHDGGNSLVRAEVYGPPGAEVVVERENGRLLLRIVEPAPLRLDASGSIRVFGPDRISLAVTSERGSTTIRDLAEGPVSVVAGDARTRLERVVGDVRVESETGAVFLKDIDGSGSVETESGDVTLELSQGSFTVRTAEGSVRLLGMEGSLDLRSNSGAIRGSSIELLGDSQLHTGSGNIELGVTTPRRLLRYRLSSEAGVIFIGAMKAYERLTYGSGRNLVEIVTENGDIRIY